MAKATPKIIKKRLRSAANIKKLARSMEVVAATKRKKAEDQALSMRPYAFELTEILHQMIKEVGQPIDHPLLKKNKSRKIALVFVTTDKGLTGSMTAEATRRLLREIKEAETRGLQVELIALGKKGTNFCLRSGYTLRANFVKDQESYSVNNVYPLAHLLMKDYQDGRYAEIRVVYTEFISALKQRAEVFTVLPLKIDQPLPVSVRVTGAQTTPVKQATVTFSFEPSAFDLLETLLPAYVRAKLYWSLLEVNASEYAARMLAMRQAADNAGEMISDLQLEYNQMRQSAITQELAEIVGASNIKR